MLHVKPNPILFKMFTRKFGLQQLAYLDIIKLEAYL